ncbi:MAG: DUF2294 domain-containing protein, partial [Cyanobacteria bacterium P01_E01_bin.34]
MTDAAPTKGQRERALSQAIQSLYKKKLGHQPGQVSCSIASDRVTIILENSVTPAEALLAEEGRDELAEEVRGELLDALYAQLTEVIEETLESKVVDILSDAKLESERTGIIVVLEDAPTVRPRSGK